MKEGQEYSVTHADIKTILDLEPLLSQHIKLVHVQGRDYRDIMWSRPARLESNGKLIISALGLGKEEFARQVLIELHSVRSPDWSLRAASSRRLTKSQLARIREIVDPLVERFIE